MLDKFDLNKKYIFSKEIALKEVIFKNGYDNPMTKDWANFADGKIVEIEDEYMSTIDMGYKTLFIPPWWCKEAD